jgi:uncharacterized membrane protein (UPF0127 family)
MKRTAAVVLLLLSAGFRPVPSTFAADPVQRALPAGASLLVEVAIPGHRARYAVAYRTDRTFLAVAYASGTNGRILWSRGLPDAPSSLVAPGPKGLFQATVKTGRAVRLYAYRWHGDSVTSAIQRRAGGSVSGDEGITVKHLVFSVRRSDTSHVGSVKYRLVTRYVWSAPFYRAVGTVQVPDYPANAYPMPNGTVRTAAGDLILIRLEVAATDQQRATGLMNRTTLDPDSGMVFVWKQLVQDGFWMSHTYIPLSIAFLSPNGTIQEMQDMQPLTTTLHYPVLPYMYAVEVNQGFFAKNGIKVGDRIELSLNP